jgi:hypothetical protein
MSGESIFVCCTQREKTMPIVIQPQTASGKPIKIKVACLSMTVELFRKGGVTLNHELRIPLNESYFSVWSEAWDDEVWPIEFDSFDEAFAKFQAMTTG